MDEVVLNHVALDLQVVTRRHVAHLGVGTDVNRSTTAVVDMALHDLVVLTTLVQTDGMGADVGDLTLLERRVPETESGHGCFLLSGVRLAVDLGLAAEVPVFMLEGETEPSITTFWTLPRELSTT